MPSYVQKGYIQRLELENFKSYKGHQVIGPFKSFTAIIGPNGAGKSNLMDAISFVLGVRSGQLRGTQLKDLIYAVDDSDREQRRKAYVKIVYVTGSREELHFMRTISTTGASDYRINDRVVTWDDYNAKMRSLGILIKTKNFLVFQGDVESVAQKSPKDLTALVEHISTSDELKKEYEELEEKKARAEEQAMFLASKKRSTAAERKQKKEQKEEAERHLALVNDLKNLKSEHFLWQLFHIDKDAEKTSEELETIHADLQNVESEQAAIEGRAQAKKKEQDKFNKEVVQAEKKAQAKHGELERMEPEMVKLKEEIKRAQKRLTAAEKEVSKKKADHEKQKGAMARLRQELEDLEATLDDLNKQSAGDEGKLQLAESQLSEYNRRKEEVGAKTSKLSQEVRVLEQQHQADVEAGNHVEDNLREISGRREVLEAQLAQVRERKEKVAVRIEALKVELAEKKGSSIQLQEQARKSRSRYLTCKTRLDEVEEKLRDAKADKRESEHDVRLAEAAESLRRLFPGVHGRLTDLCKLNQRKYQLAVTVGLGRNMDGVVVDDEKTGKDCIQYLKEQRVPPMTFIPLSSVKAKPVQERLRSIGGTAKLLIDVIEYDPVIERAVLYACGNTIVCDTLAEAKRIAFGGEERHKVVSMDGTIIAKSGNITGGSSASYADKARSWDNKDLEGLKRQRNSLEEELNSLGNQKAAEAEVQELSGIVKGLERQLQYSLTDENQNNDKLRSVEAQLEALVKEEKRQRPELDKVTAMAAGRQEEIRKKHARINEIADRIFSEFSKKVGVASIREYEENYLKRHEELAASRLKYNNQIAKLRAKLQYQESQDMEAPMKKVEKSIANEQQALARLQQQMGDAKAAADGVQAQLEEIKAQAQKAKAVVEEVEREYQALKKKVGDETQRSGKLKKQITTKEMSLEQLYTRRSEIIESCELEQIRLPVRDSGSGEAMGVDSAEPSGAGRGPAIDYSNLSRQNQQDLPPAEREARDADFKRRLEAMAAEIEATAPNLKALDQYETLREKEREATKVYEGAQMEAKAIADRFNAVRQERHDRFSEAFKHISDNIDKIYKQLTMSNTHPLGGSAFLTLESVDDPFLAGIKFTAMPPTKRFRDMEQLSGGEKTVAALALLFSIHSYRPSPFFVLDEVDAALDNLNVAKVAAYIRSKSRDEAGDGHAGAQGFQSVVISLKDQFYDKADALVGVYRDSERSCSRTLTFDLTRFD